MDRYPLTVRFHIEGDQTPFSTQRGSLLSTNRDPDKMTVVLMTGTTALVRAVGWRMEGKGMTYPGEDVLPWFQSADFRHISNESSFNPACPNANPVQDSLMFCSRPEYIRLLDVLGVNVVELSGNHNNDWGREASTYSLSLYNERGWGVFAGGANLNEAVQPLQIEHNGNRIAFLGCNKAGPPAAWATESEPGAAPCDFEALGAQIRSLRDEGVLPIVTFQHNEVYVPTPGEAQRRDFLWAADQGAVVVSGSQAHFPQGFAFENGALVHFGLGNLFFDQMDIPVVGTRREFLDRHVFYNGRYVGTELLTAMLEDYARPRPMTAAEREQFLMEIFSASGW